MMVIHKKIHTIHVIRQKIIRSNIFGQKTSKINMSHYGI